MTFYKEMAAVAAELFAEFGKPVTLTRETGPQDDVEGTAGGTIQPLPTQGVFTQFREDYRARSEVLASDRLLLINASRAPLLTDRLLDGSVNWKIVQVDEINPGGIPLVYLLRLRQ